MAESLAEVYLDAPRQLNLPTGPGRQLHFIAGHARVMVEQDLTAVLRRDDLTVYPSERYADWWKDWLDKCGEFEPARAKIEVDGVVHAPPYATLLAQPPEEAVVGEYQGAVTAPKRKGGRPRAEASLAASEIVDGSNSAPVDPDGLDAVGGPDPLDAYVGWNNNHPD